VKNEFDQLGKVTEPNKVRHVQAKVASDTKEGLVQYQERIQSQQWRVFRKRAGGVVGTTAHVERREESTVLALAVAEKLERGGSVDVGSSCGANDRIKHVYGRVGRRRLGNDAQVGERGLGHLAHVSLAVLRRDATVLDLDGRDGVAYGVHKHIAGCDGRGPDQRGHRRRLRRR
jgi:hypothetical protein